MLAREVSFLCGTAHISNMGVVALFLIISRFLAIKQLDLKTTVKMNRLCMAEVVDRHYRYVFWAVSCVCDYGSLEECPASQVFESRLGISQITSGSMCKTVITQQPVTTCLVKPWSHAVSSSDSEARSSALSIA